MGMEDSIDTLEIADLEYDVGGMGSEEPGDAAVSNEGVVIYFVVPK